MTEDGEEGHYLGELNKHLTREGLSLAKVVSCVSGDTPTGVRYTITLGVPDLDIVCELLHLVVTFICYI